MPRDWGCWWLLSGGRAPRVALERRAGVRLTWPSACPGPEPLDCWRDCCRKGVLSQAGSPRGASRPTNREGQLVLERGGRSLALLRALRACMAVMLVLGDASL
jgi:hypothetical protein